MIALESDSITLVAGGVLAANGGGGGQGGQSDGVAPFESGEDASAGTRNASGGGSAGSIGGDGAALAPGTGQDGTLAVLNGGGGGGGVGFVVLFVDNLDNAGVISSPLVGAFPRVSSP
jgi:hypothetical protein